MVTGWHDPTVRVDGQMNFVRCVILPRVLRIGYLFGRNVQLPDAAKFSLILMFDIVSKNTFKITP